MIFLRMNTCKNETQSYLLSLLTNAFKGSPLLLVLVKTMTQKHSYCLILLTGEWLLLQSLCYCIIFRNIKNTLLEQRVIYLVQILSLEWQQVMSLSKNMRTWPPSAVHSHKSSQACTWIRNVSGYILLVPFTDLSSMNLSTLSLNLLILSAFIESCGIKFTVNSVPW